MLSTSSSKQRRGEAVPMPPDLGGATTRKRRPEQGERAAPPLVLLAWNDSEISSPSVRPPFRLNALWASSSLPWP
jgi:hypothetical protein